MILIKRGECDMINMKNSNIDFSSNNSPFRIKDSDISKLFHDRATKLI